jgi:DNA-binding CsgD family transcriptional regulator
MVPEGSGLNAARVRATLGVLRLLPLVENPLEIVGREDELHRVREFVETSGAGGPTALVLEGEAGIGKSTLWRVGVAGAREQGLRVLVSQPSEAERGLAYTVLGDLFEGVLVDVRHELPAPRRRALEVALLLDEDPDLPVDPRSLAVAVRSTVELLCKHEPLVLAVDDVQWIDGSSASALAFALRRLSDVPVSLLLAQRVGTEDAPPALAGELDPGRVRRLPVGPLSLGAIHRFLRDRLERPFGRQTLLRIHERSGGNPFFALELARAVDADGDPFKSPSVPQTLEQLVGARLSGLPASTREALAFASALGTARASLLARAGVSMDALDAAVAAGVIERDAGTIRFTHPLLSSALYEELGEEQRNVHARIAGIVEEPLLRARHLALSKDTPDAEAAAALDEAARAASARGASATAAELAEHAVRLTPPGAQDDRRRRALAAARAHQAAGEWTRARSIASDLLAEREVSSWRAEALILLAELEGADRARALLEEALTEASSRPELQSLIHCRLAWVERFRATSDHARAALELADQLDDDVLRVRARAVQAILGWFVGSAPAPSDLPALAHHLPSALGAARLVQEATLAVVNTLAPASTRAEARALFEREYREWRERDEPRSARALWGLAWVEFWAGRWELAAAHAQRAHDISIQYGLEVPQDHLPSAVIAVHRGRLELAREHSERAFDLAEKQFGLRPPQHLAVVGLVALGQGDPAAAMEWFDKADRRAADLAWGEPSVRWWTSDHVELLLEVGRLDDADRVLEAWEADAARVEREWVLAHVTRCRGLVAAAQGEVDQAIALLNHAVAQHEAVGDPFGRARAELALGVVRRRARQKRAARAAIHAALSGFERLGAETWAEKARHELGSIGGRRREEGLTGAERRVAALVVEGRTNREVAAALFLGERTVASHLTHIYAKLGVRSRTELARRLTNDRPESSKVQTF